MGTTRSLILFPLYVEVTPPSLFSFAFVKHHHHHHHHHLHHYIIIITNAVAFVRIACLCDLYHLVSHYPVPSSLRCSLLLFQKVILLSLTGDNKDYGGIHVKCISQYMQLTLERDHYKEIDPETLRLRDPGCKVAFYNKTIMVIRAPLGNCGTKSSIQGKLILFTNDVYAEVSGSSAISRVPAYQFGLQCLYYTSVKISLHSFKAEPKGPIIITPTPGKCAVNNVFSSLINRLRANCGLGR